MPPGRFPDPRSGTAAICKRATDWIAHFSAAELAELDAAVRASSRAARRSRKYRRQAFRCPRSAGAGGHPRELLEGRGFAMLRGFRSGNIRAKSRPLPTSASEPGSAARARRMPKGTCSVTSRIWV
jgi:hypothetical protein